jgi:hypothetical protein
MLRKSTTPIIRRYISGYISRQRIVAVWGDYLWMVSVAAVLVAWLRHNHRLPDWPMPNSRDLTAAGAIAIALVLIPAMARLARHRNLVEAAIEIEQQIPQFDQRLITVASNPPESSLLTQITAEVESIARDHRPKVSLRPLRGPILATIAAGLVLMFFR